MWSLFFCKYLKIALCLQKFPYLFMITQPMFFEHQRSTPCCWWINDGGHHDRWRVANRLRVPLPDRWGWCQQRPDGDGGPFFSDWGISQLACHLALHQLMHVCWNAECKSWKWVQQWRSEATKSWKGRWHTLAAQNSLTFISYYYDVQRSFEQCICC